MVVLEEEFFVGLSLARLEQAHLEHSLLVLRRARLLRVAPHLVSVADIGAASEVHLVQVLERPLLGLR